ncbi:hypothetical protein [Streptomyces sp. H27-D2]|uniref:hypothetical protein n=1 Tax=Streptomyces sp. H27-D2 TaxID=3046304 RepID=UPI002DBC5E01|nr:hypothetical protein [Streptomyces sp. H27-D2]MEC4017173.1 hypothetical protein [Streptomyces sp. H27-D2]
MARLLPLIVIAVCVYMYFRAKRNRVLPVLSAGAPRRTGALDGLVPRAELNTAVAAPDPALQLALTAVGDGDWQPAARLLAGTGDDWERRAARAYGLGDAAGRAMAAAESPPTAPGALTAPGDTPTDPSSPPETSPSKTSPPEPPGWSAAWQRARPDDPDAALVHARALVSRAWELRGAQRARDTSTEQFAEFRAGLRESLPAIARAEELSAADPSPYVAEIWTMIGLGSPHEEMRALWAKITERAPHHYEAHYSALQYWCAKWQGSAELAAAFAADAAAGAPRGALLSALPLISFYEHERDNQRPRPYRKQPVTAMVDAALADVAAAPSDHPRLAEVRHLLAWFLLQQKRYAASAEQFRLVDGYVNALPWRYSSDPAKLYSASRDAAVLQARHQRGHS